MRTIRIFFSKTGEAAYISHLDLQRVMARGLRISGLPVWYSQGFNPHIYMSFALPLPLGHQSLCEAVDCRTEDERDDFSPFAGALSSALPKGIEVSAIALPVFKADDIARAAYGIGYPDAALLRKAAEEYNGLKTAPVVHKTKKSETALDFKTILPALAAPENGEELRVELPAGSREHYSPALLTGFLESRLGLPAGMARVVRRQVYTHGGESFR